VRRHRLQLIRNPAHIAAKFGVIGFRRKEEGGQMLWLILGIILLVIAIAGGAIIHPVIFVLAILALFMFVSGWRGRTV
jgi:hypothetical protein